MNWSYKITEDQLYEQTDEMVLANWTSSQNDEPAQFDFKIMTNTGQMKVLIKLLFFRAPLTLNN